jgi:hypothetical protein
MAKAAVGGNVLNEKAIAPDKLQVEKLKKRL